MTAYLVRVRETKEAVGIYNAFDSVGLFRAIDEHTDPFNCEYTVLPEGGIFFKGTCPSIPNEKLDERLKALWKDPEITERWEEVLCSGKRNGRKAGWKRFEGGEYKKYMLEKRTH